MDISGLHNFSEIYGGVFKTSNDALDSSGRDPIARQNRGAHVRNFFRNAPAPDARVKETDGPDPNKQDSTIRRVEITVERETVSLHFPAGTVAADGEQRCPCCGQVLSAPQPACTAHTHDTTAIPGKTIEAPIQKK